MLKIPSVFICIILYEYVLADDCVFMKKYSLQDIFNKPDVQDAFLMDASYWEGKFARHKLGLNYFSALTYDGGAIDYETGISLPQYLHDFSAASKVGG